MFRLFVAFRGFAAGERQESCNTPYFYDEILYLINNQLVNLLK